MKVYVSSYLFHHFFFQNSEMEIIIIPSIDKIILGFFVKDAMLYRGSLLQDSIISPYLEKFEKIINDKKDQ